MDLASFELVRGCASALLAILGERLVDVLLANDEEAAAFREAVAGVADTHGVPGKLEMSLLDVARDHSGSRAPNGIKRVTADSSGGAGAGSEDGKPAAVRQPAPHSCADSQDPESGAIASVLERPLSTASQVPADRDLAADSAAEPAPQLLSDSLSSPSRPPLADQQVSVEAPPSASGTCPEEGSSGSDGRDLPPGVLEAQTAMLQFCQVNEGRLSGRVRVSVWAR